MESEKQPYMLRNKSITVSILFIIACCAGAWRMSTGSFVNGSFPGIVHATFFLFFILILAQHYKMIAYVLLPTVLIGWSSFDYMYDIAAPILSIDEASGIIQTLRIQQHILRLIYHITPLDLMGFGLAGGCLFGAIYSMRHHLVPVYRQTSSLIEIIAGIYVVFSLIFLPLGLITGH